MKMLTASAALSTGILAFAAGGTAEAADFTQASIQGSYSLSLNGTITFAGGKSLFLPTWSVGVFQADGAGNIVAGESVVNVGGCVIVKQTGTTGTYSVNPNGTGRAEVQVTQSQWASRTLIVPLSRDCSSRTSDTPSISPSIQRDWTLS